MRFIPPLVATILLVLSGCRGMSPAGGDPIGYHPAEDGVVQVLVTYQPFDPIMPWQKRPPAMRYGYAIMVGKDTAITTASLVRNQTLVEIRKCRSGLKIPAVVDFQDPQVNLALLRILPPSSPTNAVSAASPDPRQFLKPVRVAHQFPKKSNLEIVQFDETGQIQSGQAQFLHASMVSSSEAGFGSLVFSILTDVNITGEGAAVLIDGDLAGVMVSYDRTSRTGSMIPYCVTEQFLDGCRQTPYRGFAAAGFMWTSLVDPAKRTYLGLPDDTNGILVLSCLPETGAQRALQPNDVILEWDGYSIDSQGYYTDPDFGRLSLPYLVMGRRKPGDKVSMLVVRDKLERRVEMELGTHRDASALIPENLAGTPPEYIVEGGLVIRELTGDYLRGFGPAWKRVLDPRIVHLYHTRQFAPSQPGERVLILSLVLPDAINIGYQDFHNSIITSLNGKPVCNMSEVFHLLDENGAIHRIGLKSMDVELVLDDQSLPAANARLAASYRIPQLRFQQARAHPSPPK